LPHDGIERPFLLSLFYDSSTTMFVVSQIT